MRHPTFRLSCGAALARLAATKDTYAASERLNRGALAPSAFSRLLGFATMFATMFHSDDYFSSGVSFTKIPESFSRFT